MVDYTSPIDGWVEVENLNKAIEQICIQFGCVQDKNEIIAKTRVQVNNRISFPSLVKYVKKVMLTVQKDNNIENVIESLISEEFNGEIDEQVKAQLIREAKKLSDETLQSYALWETIKDLKAKIESGEIPIYNGKIPKKDGKVVYPKNLKKINKYQYETNDNEWQPKRFNNFKQRSYDFEALEPVLLQQAEYEEETDYFKLDEEDIEFNKKYKLGDNYENIVDGIKQEKSYKEKENKRKKISELDITIRKGIFKRFGIHENRIAIFDMVFEQFHSRYHVEDNEKIRIFSMCGKDLRIVNTILSIISDKNVPDNQLSEYVTKNKSLLIAKAKQIVNK